MYEIEERLKKTGIDPRLENCKKHEHYWERLSIDCSECKKYAECNIYTAIKQGLL